MKYFVLICLLFLSASCLAISKEDIYTKNGVVVGDFPWEIIDYEMFLDSLSDDTIPLPKISSPGSMHVFRKIISDDNLTVLNSKKLSTEEKIFMVADFTDIVDAIIVAYITTHDKSTNNNERELAYLASYKTKITGNGLRLLDEVIASTPTTKENSNLIGDLKEKRASRFAIFDYMIKQFGKKKLYSDESLIILSEAILENVVLFTLYLDKQTKKVVKNQLNSVVAKCKNKEAKKNLLVSASKL